MAGVIGVNCLLSVFAFICFTQNFSFVDSLYGWLRDFRIGEITFAGGNLWRVFLQSQIYAAIGAPLFFYLTTRKYLESKKINLLLALTFVFSSLTVVLSLSRSFWLGCLAAFGVMLLIFLFKEKIGLKKICAFGAIFIFILALEVLFVWLVAGSGSGDLISKRLTDTSEAAGISRVNQLKPLSLEVAKHPVLGSGYGTAVTYQTRDPRILKNNPDGWYTTFTFEWGYLDILLKIGLFGLIVYLLLIWKVIEQLRITNYPPSFAVANFGETGELRIGLILGLVVLLVVHMFSPYLNHPLGIGYIVLLSSFGKKDN